MPNIIKAISKTIFDSIFETLAPRHCEVCGEYIGTKDRQFEFICDKCVAQFPVAPIPSEVYNRYIINIEHNDLSINNAIALMYISENSIFIKTIYALKYSGFHRVGIELGKELGRLMLKYNMTSYDALVPVPIHPARRRERGFNQAEIICKGIQKELNLPINNKIVKRTKHTISQTKLSKEDRRTNVKNVFSPGKSISDISGKSILIIDDVLTTGSTTNEIGKVLKKYGAKTVDCASLALA